MKMEKTAVLLVNLGTPNAPTYWDVYKYLTEFLLDPRVMDLPWFKRQLLVRGLIIPKRLKSSTQSYKKIWSSDGSPLLSYGQKVKTLLQECLGSQYLVELAMRYQNPSISKKLDQIMQYNPKRLIIIPLFPQYASATTGSIFQEVFRCLSKYTTIPKVTCIDQFANHPALIKAFKELANPYRLHDYDHVLMSFHGLPERQSLKSDYRTQCFATADALAHELQLSQDQYSIAFQSRLGKEAWLTPYTNETVLRLGSERKKVLVFCPSFICDCLETIYEIGIEYKHLFKQAGGDTLDLVPGLNDHPAFIRTLVSLVNTH